MNRTIAALGIGGMMLVSSAAAETIKVATWNIENFTVGSRTAAELSAMADLVDILDADVVAMQEVDGPEAARQIFDPNEYEFHFTSQNNPQRTGFAIRRGLAFTPNPDFEELDMGDVRSGADLTVTATRTTSTPFRQTTTATAGGSSGRSRSSRAGSRRGLRRASPVVVLGDFNRRFNIAGDDMCRS